MVVTRARNWRWEELEKDTIELSALAQHFELYNRTEGKSPKTIDWHNLALRQFHRFLMESEKSTSLGELGEAEVREFILYLQGRYKLQVNPFVSNNRSKLAAISIQTYIRALRAFFNWLYKEGYTSENRLVKANYPNGVVARGRALHDLARECLKEIEMELDGHAGITRLKDFVALTREGMGGTEASRVIGVSREYACRVLKRHLVELFAEKMQSKVR